jgi:Fe-S-cluster containining protein
VFAINAPDVARLQAGMEELTRRDRGQAARVRERARVSRSRLLADFPGNPRTGILDVSEEAKARFADFGNDQVCPVLDPETGLCDLYDARPMTCRTFGPPVRSEDGLGVCELCYHGAADEQIVACEMTPDPDDLESKLVKKVQGAGGFCGQTIVAWAIREARE